MRSRFLRTPVRCTERETGALLQTHRWIAYVGLTVILYVAVEMIYRGTLDIMKVAST
jgi:predicted tellurium resistance membrane protein TerC